MEIYKSTLVDIEYEPGKKYGMATWHGKALTDSYKEAMNQIATLIEVKNLSCWLGNMTNLEIINPDLQTWTNQVWFPRVLNAGLKNIAVVISATALARMSVNQIMVKAGETTTKNFKSVEDAKEWLDNL